MIELNGRQVVGFGDAAASGLVAADPNATSLAASLVGFALGGLAGAAVGAIVDKGAGAAVGAIIGGIGGGVLTYAVKSHAETTQHALPPPSWRRVQPVTSSDGNSTIDLSGLKSGQQIAVAVAGPNGTPVSPEDAAKIGIQFTALATAPVALPTKNFVQYPPGAQLPADWPKDDDLGSGAYRITADVIADAPPQIEPMRVPPPSVGVFEVWVR